MIVDGKELEMNPGDILVMKQGKVHQFTAIGRDAIIFEFSTQHFEDDSYFIATCIFRKVIEDAVEVEERKWPFSD